MLAAQGGVCAICRKPEMIVDERTPGGIRRLAIDHDHVTGRIRGLLCNRCNKCLSSHLTAADFRLIADYLEGHGGPILSAVGG
jgi:Recombination endonuclease VII